MDVSYRYATAEDIDQIVNARVSLVEEDSGPFLPKEKASFIAANKETLAHNFAINSMVSILACHNQTLIGTCSVCLYSVLPGRKLPNGKNGYIQNVYVTPAYRRKGIGQQMLRMMLTKLKEMGYRRVTLHATEPGKKLFLSCGFVEEDTSLTYLSYSAATKK